jgi:hypothetical protein
MPEVEFNVPALGERNDLATNELPVQALRVSQNVFRNERGRLAVRPGYDQIGAIQPATRIMGVGGLRKADGTDKQLAATLTGVWQFDGTNWVDITLGGSALSGSSSDHVRFTVMGVSGTYKIIITNAVNTPKIWDGAAAAYANLGGTPGVSICSAVVANRLLLLQAPDIVKVSEFNDPETYPAGNGFTVRLIDAGDLMVGMDRLTRTSAAILGQESQWVAVAQNGTNPFRFERIDDKPGPLSSACVVRWGNAVYWLGEDYNTYRFDGITCQEIGWAMKPFVRAAINAQYRKMSHGAYHDRIGKIFWYFVVASGDGPNGGIFLDVRTGEMGRLSYARKITSSGRIRVVTSITWNALTGTWNNLSLTYPTWNSFGSTVSERRTALGGSTGTVYASDIGDGSDDGDAIQVIFETPLKSYAGWPNRVVPDTFESFFHKTANSTVVDTALGYTETLAQDPAYMDMGTFDVSIDQRNAVDLTSAGEKRFVSLRHQSSVPHGQLEWEGGLFKIEDAELEKGPTNDP